MTIDTSTQPFTATAERLVDTVTELRDALTRTSAELEEARGELGRARAEATVQTRLAEALMRQLEDMKFELRIALNAPAYLKARYEQAEEEVRRLRDQAATVELPRYVPEPEPVRRRSERRSRRGRHQ